MPTLEAGTPAALKALAETWAGARAAERANAQLYTINLCDALGVPRPRAAGSGYEFEFPVKIGARDGTEDQGFVDCYKAGHFVLEAKDADAGATDAALRKAFGQARLYALNDPTGTAPPYLLVLDVAKTLIVWHRWNGTFGGFQAGHRIDLPTLHTRPADIALLRDIWLDPSKRDPRQHAQAVTTEIATKLATLASALEGRGFEQERVARFLMRVVFSCFAEDVDLLPRDAFRQTVERAGVAGDPERFRKALEALWQAMDHGGMFGYESLLRFNGHFFKDAEALPLTRDEIALLLEAAKADWQEVEPTIFGTLLTRALDPVERHRLGAEYTPRAFIERIVRPTVEEPVRERWTAVQAEVLQLTGTGKSKDKAAAEQRVREFLGWMHGLRVLDPACGSGNFLYVTMHILKEIEHEAVRELEGLTGHPEFRMQEIGPANFLGLEVKPWAREIAELTLWIGFHQFWKRHHAVQPPEPVLQDTGTLELRDAVLSWDAVQHVSEKDRPDPTPRLVHPVTGELVPDPEARLPYMEHVNARTAAWPEADFIVGNPPYLGSRRMRAVLGEGYVDALHAAYPSIPDGVDFVMYWWAAAAAAVASGRTIRAGLITTNSITQQASRRVTAAAGAKGAQIIWAIPTHPWIDEADAAAVRVAMTVIGRPQSTARLVHVDDEGAVTGQWSTPRLNVDLTIHADVATASKTALRANAGLAFMGVKLVGKGFILSDEEAHDLLAKDVRHADIVRPYMAGRDLGGRARSRYVIDFGLRTEADAQCYPILYDIVRTRVKPERDANKPRYRDVWWQFGVPNAERRLAAAGLSRVIATVEVSKHRYFRFISTDVVPDGTLITIGSDSAFVLGVLSSGIHAAWALAAGGRLGIGNDPRYSNGVTFAPFPFPAADAAAAAAIAAAAERIEAHRETVLTGTPTLTLTAMYNVVDKLREGATLSPAERRVHDSGACGVLRMLHDELDRAVAMAYGWTWPTTREDLLNRLVRLQADRVAEEARGVIRWLRPDYQSVRAGAAPSAIPADVPEGDDDDAGLEEPAAGASVETMRAPWPRDAVGQITALRGLTGEAPISLADAVARFEGAKADIVRMHLDMLAVLGEVTCSQDGRYALVDVRA